MLTNPKKIDYFKQTVTDYINYIEKSKNIEKLFIVTFPHKNHITKFLSIGDVPYKHNVSNIVDSITKNKKKIIHLNFTNLISSENYPLKKEDYKKKDPSSHLNEDYYHNFFIEKIMNYVFVNLKT